MAKNNNMQNRGTNSYNNSTQNAQNAQNARNASSQNGTNTTSQNARNASSQNGTSKIRFVFSAARGLLWQHSQAVFVFAVCQNVNMLHSNYLKKRKILCMKKL